MSERAPLAMYPERPSEHAESFKRAFEIFSQPPDFELSPEEHQEVTDFEEALCEGKLPKGYEYLENSTRLPEKNINDIDELSPLTKSYCVDWYMQTPEGTATLQRMGYAGNLTDKESVKAYLAKAIQRVKEEGLKDGYDDSRLWAERQFGQKLREEIQDGRSEIVEPEFLSLQRNPQQAIDRITYSRSLKAYYKTIETNLRMQENTEVNQAKLVMVTLHRERINQLIAMTYRQVLPLLDQYRLSPDTLTSAQVDQLMEGFPTLQNTDTSDIQKMARIHSMLDKFIVGIDRENGFSQISASLESMMRQLEHQDQSRPTETAEPAILKYDLDPDMEVDAATLKQLVEQILRTYGLLRTTKDKSEANVGLWRPAFSKLKSSLSTAAKGATVWIPKNFSRKLGQRKPTGVLPLLDHEITHVLQHTNAAKLGIGLLRINRASRSNLWFETGASAQESESFEKNLGIRVNSNFHYLKAMQVQLAGGNISQCIRAFYDSLMQSGELDDEDQDEAISTAVDRTLRLFRHGGEWAEGTGYLTNTEPLEYAEQEILTRNMPENLHWLYFVGRVSFQNLAQLYRIGWLKEEDIFIPEKMPSEIAMEALSTNP